MLGKQNGRKLKENSLAICWQTLLVIGVMFTAFEIPLRFALDYEPGPFHLWADGVLSLVFLSDVYLRLTKKLQTTMDEWSFHQNEKAAPYHKTVWLPLDLAASLPWDLVIYSLNLELPAKVLYSLRLLRIARVARVRDLAQIRDFLPKAVKSLLFLGSILLILHIVACGWMLLSPRPELDPVTFYNVSLYWTITTLTTVGYGDITPTTNMARVFTMGVMLLGVAAYGLIIGNFSRMIIQSDRNNQERKEKLAGLRHFLKNNNVPDGLQREVFSFYNHLLKKSLSQHDNQIINELPQALRAELQLYLKIKLIREIHIFSDCSNSCLKMVAEKLEQSFFAPNEHIIKEGDIGEEMYILGHGEVEVVAGEKTLAQLKAGQFFGEMALLEDTIRTADVKAKSYCDLYIFKKNDFLDVIEKYPKLGAKFQEIYRKRTSDLSSQTKAA